MRKTPQTGIQRASTLSQTGFPQTLRPTSDVRPEPEQQHFLTRSRGALRFPSTGLTRSCQIFKFTLTR